MGREIKGVSSLGDQIDDHDQDEEDKGPLDPDASKLDREVDSDERSDAAAAENRDGHGIMD